MLKKLKLYITSNKSLGSKTINQIKYIFVLAIYFTIGCLSVFSAPSDLDPTFGNGGIVVSSPDGSDMSFSSAMALQSDGKIIRVGGIFPTVAEGIIIARYNSDGNLDTTFGNKGWTDLTFGGDEEIATAVTIQSDGKIVVGATTNLPNTGRDIGIARFNSDGSLDTAFGNSGKTTINFGPPDYLTSIKVGNDGKIVFGGSARGIAIGSFNNTLGRLNADGSLDSTFGIDGKIFGGNGGGRINDLLIQSDGTTIVAINIANQTNSYMIARKYNIDGSEEWEHRQYQEIPGYIGYYGIVAQSDGKIVLVGEKQSRAYTIRLNADGSEDTSFNPSTQTPIGRSLDVAIQSDGKIVATGIHGSHAETFAVIRYNPNGSLDNSFGTGGVVETDITSDLDSSSKVLIQTDGKILVGGSSRPPSDSPSFFSMVRYQGDDFIPQTPKFDYDGDGKADISVYRPSNGVWYLNQSTNGFTAAQFGIASDRIVPADFDGDGKTDIAIYRDGTWWTLQSGDNTVRVLQFGVADDIPQSGDFDGDGKDDLVVYRPSEGNWYVFRSSNNSFYAVPFGLSDDIPQSSDFDGDGITDIAVFRPSNGTWYVQNSLSTTTTITQFGLSDDVPVANDFDGDGNSDIAIWRPSNGDWYVLKSSGGEIERQQFGQLGDIPIAADYDGDTKVDFAVFRPSNGVWYQKLSTEGNSQEVFGFGTDKPTPSAYNP